MNTSLRKLTFTLLLVSCTAGSLTLVSCSNSSQPNTETVIGDVHVPSLLARKGVQGTPEENKTIQDTYNKAIQDLKANADDPKPLLSLASVYITEGRITGNSGYYSNAAIKVLNDVLNGEATSPDQRFQALSFKSAVLLNVHQFKDALDAANEGLKIATGNAGIWGAAVDAHVELGHYKEAVDACDQMNAIRPDLRSYSRASYLRQIYGQNDAAIDAMKMAVQSGVNGLESTEWARVTLGDLYYNTGKLDSAALTYRTSLVYRPDYPFALMGMARVARARKQLDTAIAYTKSAIRVVSEAPFVSYLGDLYEEQGNIAKATEVHNDVVKLLQDAEDNTPKDAPIKHNGARELAIAYMNIGNYNKAMEWAKKDYDMRPDNIDANDLMAWIAFLKKDYNSAKTYAQKTQITGAKNPLLLYKNGVIFSAAGDKARGESLKREALSLCPYIDPKIIKAGNV